MAPTNNPLSCEIRLTEANWSEVYKLLKNDMKCFGEAGQEILTGIPFNQKFLEPISGPTISERMMQDGAIVTVERPTDSYATMRGYLIEIGSGTNAIALVDNGKRFAFTGIAFN